MLFFLKLFDFKYKLFISFKEKLINQILIFLSERLGEVEISGKIPINEKKTLKKIKEDMIRISKFKRRKSTDFHLECLNIIENY